MVRADPSVEVSVHWVVLSPCCTARYHKGVVYEPEESVRHRTAFTNHGPRIPTLLRTKHRKQLNVLFLWRVIPTKVRWCHFNDSTFLPFFTGARETETERTDHGGWRTCSNIVTRYDISKIYVWHLKTWMEERPPFSVKRIVTGFSEFEFSGVSPGDFR